VAAHVPTTLIGTVYQGLDGLATQEIISSKLHWAADLIKIPSIT
jgi:hypothetical protein